MSKRPNFTNLFQQAKRASGDEDLKARRDMVAAIHQHYWSDQDGLVPKALSDGRQDIKPDFKNLFAQVKQAEANDYVMDRVALTRTLKSRSSKHFNALREEVETLPLEEREAWLTAINEVIA
ncbi:hypothetical protein KW459_15795 [Vibrio fluvialis]|nr:hypothetical protein [Vibrio fluvialis]